MKSRDFSAVVKNFFIIISFVLTGCSLQTKEEAPAASTIVVSRALPSQTPRPIPQATSATPTLTVMPTLTPSTQPTIPVPMIAVQPTAAETQMSIPTVADMEVTQQVLWLFETNNGCQLPCWWGITPGQTTWQTAQEFLSGFDFDIYELDSDSESAYYGVIIPLPIEVFFADRWAPSIITRNDVVEHIFTNVANGKPPKGTLAQYYLSSFLTTYGAPSEVGLFTYSSPYVGDDLPFVTTLFYADQGIAAAYSINGERQGEVVKGCIQEEPVTFLSLWSPDLKLTFEEVTTGSSALNRDYLSLEESTKMSIATFYETFKKPENTTCLETPADLWR